MKRGLLISVILFTLVSVHAQERIFSLGGGATFVTKDSSTFNVTVDLNRVPGQTEKAGGYYFLNEVINDTSKWGYYIKPTMDINIGSGVTSAPNNISIGLPIGVAYDIPKTKIGLFSWYFEGSPEMVADREFKNNLYYFSVNSYIKYSIVARGESLTLDIIPGISNANGVRNQMKIKTTDYYGRITIPVYLKLVAWKATTKKGKDYKRISWTTSFKFNHVYADNKTVNKSNNYIFLNSKFDFYIIKNLGINVTYNYGQEEPVFKQNHAVTAGITLAR